jgi:hypothetical protein
MANFTRTGYGQVEPNQLSAQKTGQIYASLPLDKSVEVLQNGEFMYYDYANKSVNAGKAAATGVVATKGEPMLVFNEIKLYEPFWRTSYKDFAMIRVGDNYVTSKLATAGYGDNVDKQQAAYQDHGDEYGYRMDGCAPRLFKTNVGDIYTTNMVSLTKTSSGSEVAVEYKVGDILAPEKVTHTGADGTSTYETLVLKLQASMPASGMAWHVVQVYTMPDGQPGLKLQRIQ